MLRKSLIFVTLVSMLVVPFSQSFAAKPSRNDAPVVTSFDVEPASASPVPILAFTATDSDGSVVGYLVTESSSEPNANNAGWSPTAPSTYTTTSVGLVTLYAWAMDDNDKVSASMSDTVDIPDPQDQIIADLQARVAALEDLLQHFSRNGNDVLITGANVHVVNGTGATNAQVNGLGNLIVGYNELRAPWGVDNRTGSHNVVVGIHHNYSSYGGLVVGYENEISGEWSSVSGGTYNIASAISSSVSGGNVNTAEGSGSSVSGGYQNIASGGAATVSGGWNSDAIGDYASVSGGNGNTATGANSSICGGSSGQASGNGATVSGGWNSSAIGDFSSVSGGNNNQAFSNRSSVSGGSNNAAWADYSSVTGGVGNTTRGNFSTVTGGNNNTSSGLYSSVSGGLARLVGGDNDWAAGSLFEDQ